MKQTIILTGVLILLAFVASADGRDDYKRAIRNGAKAKLTLKVIDETGAPVSNAVCDVGFLDVATTIDETRGLSNNEGLLVAEGKAKHFIGGTINKEGYYQSLFEFKKGDPPGLINNGGESSEPYYASKVKDGRWLPWNPTIPVVLREVRNPIPMYVKRFEGKFPNGAVVGFDCEKGDFVEPHGSGITADFLVHTKEIRLSATDQDGGILVLPSHSNSVFKSDYLAPEDGYATNLFSTVVINERNGRTESVLYDYGDDYGLSRNLIIFKSRIKRDSDGKIISANYGKIYGNFQYWRDSVKFLYYFSRSCKRRILRNVIPSDFRLRRGCGHVLG